MSFVYEDQSYPSLSDFINTKKQKYDHQVKLEFAHQVDGKVISVLKSLPIKKAIEQIVETSVSAQMGVLLSTGITVDPRTFPLLYRCLETSCERLGIPVPHTVITNEMSGINAFTIGTDDFSFIAISNATPRLLDEDELRFIIGHECGHIAYGHVVYHYIGTMIGKAGSILPVVGPIVANTITLPLNTWSRCSEITADRAGLLCCRDINKAQSALVKLISGFTDISGLNIDVYLDQSMQSMENHSIGAFNEFFMTHPLIPKRLRALRYFHDSEMYYRLIGESRPKNKELVTDDQLQRLIKETMRVM